MNSGTPILDACYKAAAAQYRDTMHYPEAFLLHPSLRPVLEAEAKEMALVAPTARHLFESVFESDYELHWKLFGIPVEFTQVGAKIAMRTQGGDVLVVHCAGEKTT